MDIRPERRRLRVKRRRNTSYSAIIAFFLLVTFVDLATALHYHRLNLFDRVIGGFVRSFITEPLTNVVIFITNLGSSMVMTGVMLVVAGYFILRKKQREATVLVVNLLGASLLNGLLKWIFNRPRPTLPHLVDVAGLSFPSGHAMISASFYGMLGYFWWRYLREQEKPTWYVVVLTSLLVFAIGLSRIYLGVHFASDVLAGFAAGGLWLIVCIWGLNRRFNS